MPDAGDLRWALPPDARPTGGYYKGLPMWTSSPRLHERAADLLRQYAPPPARILDIGAGAGAFTRRLLDAGYHDLAAVELRAESFGVPGVRVHAVNLNGPFAEAPGLEPADAVVALEVLEHLENPWAFARQCARLVRPGGVLILSTPNIESGRSRIEFLLTAEFRYFDRQAFEQVGHQTALPSGVIRRAFGTAGFEMLERSYDRHERPRGPRSPRKAIRWLLYGLTYWLMRGDRRGESSLFVFRRK